MYYFTYCTVFFRLCYLDFYIVSNKLFISESYKLVISWVLAQNDLFETDQSFTAPFVDLSVPFGVSQDEFSVVTFVLLVNLVDVVLVREKTSNDLF